MLENLGVSWQDTDMSFSAVNERTGLEYGAASLRRLFAQRRNLISLHFTECWEIRRFYAEAPALLATDDDQLTLGAYLDQQGYSPRLSKTIFSRWPARCGRVRCQISGIFPARYFVAFMANHRMLQISDRPQWRVVKGARIST